MKILFVTLLIFSVGLTSGFCQTRKWIYVPRLKENKIIDSVINLELRFGEQPYYSNYIFVGISENPIRNFFTFSVYLNQSEDAINEAVNNLMGNRSVGYFTYKNHVIFVSMDKNCEFFKQDHKSKAFKFIYERDFRNHTPDINYLSNVIYIYKNGVLSVDTIPPMR